MNNNIVSTPAIASLQPITHLHPQTQPVSARVLKLALDVHLLQHVVAIWIAALALEHQLPLAARDAHFDRVTGLQILKR